MSVSAFDAMHDALEQGARVGYEMKPGFTTHWPMGADALIELGHPEIVHDWVDLFLVRHRHYDLPASTRPFDIHDEAEWRAARGDFERVGDWLVAFDRELQERPWRELLVEWWPRLVFGVGAGLTHALIRTMHAVRSIERTGGEPTDAQRRELAMALSYWAGRYVEQPAAKDPHGDRRLPEILGTIPRLDPDYRIALLQKGYFLHLSDIEGWEQAVDRIAAPADVGEAFSDLTVAFAQAQLAHRELFPIPQVHTLTGPAAMRVLLPYLPQELHAPSFVAAWQVCAALTASFFLEPNDEEMRAEPDPDFEPLTREELVAQAVAHGDMHSIKVTEACLREHAIRPDPRYLQLAQHVIEAQPAFFRGDWRQSLSSAAQA